MIPPLIEQHVEKLRRLYPDVRVRELPTPEVQGVLVEVPNIRLPAGWSRKTTTVRFVVPFAYPSAPPDSFWTDAGLTLEGGNPPQGARQQPIPGLPDAVQWFSWHVQQWDANAHTLLTFLEVVRDRLRKVQ